MNELSGQRQSIEEDDGRGQVRPRPRADDATVAMETAILLEPCQQQERPLQNDFIVAPGDQSETCFCVCVCCLVGFSKSRTAQHIDPSGSCCRVPKPEVLPGFTGFYWVLLGFTGFYWVLLSFTGFYWASLVFNGFCEFTVCVSGGGLAIEFHCGQGIRILQQPVDDGFDVGVPGSPCTPKRTNQFRFFLLGLVEVDTSSVLVPEERVQGNSSSERIRSRLQTKP